MAKELFTIGYSGFPDINLFIQTLKEYGIQVVIDVRSIPLASAFFENYNKDRLSHYLKDNGIYYLNYARQFGARQKNPDFYKRFENKNGKTEYRLDFETFSKSDQFMDGVLRVEQSNAIITFMCAEKKPSECHRAILVSRAFSDRGHKVTHIEPNGKISTQLDIEKELIEKYFPNREQLSFSFYAENNKTEADYVVEAYRERNREIGFKLEDLYK